MNLNVHKKYVTVADFLFFGLIVIVSADVSSRITVANESFGHALSQSIYYLAIQPIGTILLLVPFGLTGSASFANKGNRLFKWFIFLLCFIPISALYFVGYNDGQVALKKHAWTAAALSVGLMPLLSLPIIGIGLIIAMTTSALIEKLKSKSKVELHKLPENTI